MAHQVRVPALPSRLPNPSPVLQGHKYLNMMENSESNHTIATDLLLTPSTSSQHGLTIPGESRDPHQPLTHGGAEGATIEEADEGPEDSQTRTHDSTSSPPLTSVPPSPTVSLRPESAHQSILSNFRRVVAQDEKEPLCVILFKWTLIVVGAIMLGCVMFVMGEVIHAWATGTLDELNRRYHNQPLSENIAETAFGNQTVISHS